MVVGWMDLIIRHYFATGIQEWERAISRKGACSLVGNPKKTIADRLR